jgi:hypothetical protein
MAKSPIDTLLAADPLDFMRNHMVIPGDYSPGLQVHNQIVGRNVQTFDMKTSDSGGAPIDSTLTVTQAENKVGYGKLTETARSVDQVNKPTKNMYNLTLYRAADAIPLKSDHVSMYFLPWASNHLTKITIPAKAPDPQGELFPEVLPNLFFTAAINGCSVFVSGTARTPTVVHAGTSEPRTKLGAENAFGFGNARAHWTSLFETEMTKGVQNLPSYGDIHAGDYRNTSGMQTTAQAELVREFLTQDYRKQLRIDGVDAWGCVFGVRNARTAEWAFYLQKNVEVTMTRLRKSKGMGSKYKPVTVNLGMRTQDELDSKGKKIIDKNTNTPKRIDLPDIIEQTVTIGMPIQVMKFFPGDRVEDGAHALIQPNQLKLLFDQFA